VDRYKKTIKLVSLVVVTFVRFFARTMLIRRQRERERNRRGHGPPKDNRLRSRFPAIFSSANPLTLACCRNPADSHLGNGAGAAPSHALLQKPKSNDSPTRTKSPKNAKKRLRSCLTRAVCPEFLYFGSFKTTKRQSVLRISITTIFVVSGSLAVLSVARCPSIPNNWRG